MDMGMVWYESYNVFFGFLRDDGGVLDIVRVVVFYGNYFFIFG